MGEKGAIVDAFVDRIEELAALEEQFADHQAAMAVIYGRRRIGKTALITEFVRDKRALYFLATEESEEQNRAAFQKQVAAFTGDELLGQVSVDNWDVLFDRLTSDGERLVVALDEFQYLGKANPAFPSVFQRIWDTMLSKRNVMVILCGSLISLMESQVLSYNSPLYGRRTAQVRMKQIPFRFYRDFFTKEIGRRELVELYSVTGGVPKYIESFRGVDDVYRGIEKSVLNSSSYLYDEPNFLLSKEVSEVGTYFSILKAVAAGNRKSGRVFYVGNQRANFRCYFPVFYGLHDGARVASFTACQNQYSHFFQKLPILRTQKTFRIFRATPLFLKSAFWCRGRRCRRNKKARWSAL